MKFATSVFLRLLAAACGAALTEVLLDFIDCVIVGHVLGEFALAGLELYLPVVNTVSAIALLVAGGTAVLHAEAMGRFDRVRADAVFSTGVVVALLVGLAGALVLWFGLDVFLLLFGGEGEVVAAARQYGRVYAAVALFSPVMTLLITMVLADGDDAVFTVGSVLSFVVNVALSWSLAHTVGIAGCAWGTFAAVVVALVCLLFHFRTRNCSLKFRRQLSASLAGRILVANPGDALASLLEAVAMLFVNWFVVRRFGSDVLPVVALVSAVTGLLFVLNGFSNAAQSLVCVYHSERNFKVLRYFSRLAFGLAVSAGLVIAVLVELWPSVPTALLGIDDAPLVPLAERALRIVAASYVFLAAFHFLNSYYAFIGESALSAAISVLRSFVMPIAGVAVGGLLFGIDGVWFGLSLALPLSLAVFFGALLLTRRRGMLPFLLPYDRDASLWTWNFVLSAEAACTVAAQIEEILKSRGVDGAAAHRAPVIVEELLETVRERNGARKVRAELTLDLNEGLDIFLRDTGEIFDVTDADRHVDSLRAYFIACAMADITHRRNLTTVGFNRNHLRLSADGRAG